MKSILRNRIESHRGHTVLGYAEGACPIVVDCGAHRGEFARSVARAWGAKSYCVEANPVLFAELQLPVDATPFNFAVAGEKGDVCFAIEANLEASHIGGGHDTAVTSVRIHARALGDFLDEEKIGDVDLLKLDIEGAEVEALASLSSEHLERIAQISVEFHDFCGFATSQDVDISIARLRAHGFQPVKFSFKTRGDMLFINRRHYRIGRIDLFRLRVIDRFRFGVIRVWRRLLGPIS